MRKSWCSQSYHSVNCLFWDEKHHEEWDNKSKPVKGSEKQPLGTLYTTHLSDVRDMHRNIIHQQWTGLCLQFWDLMSGIVSQWSGMRSRTERYSIHHAPGMKSQQQGWSVPYTTLHQMGWLSAPSEYSPMWHASYCAMQVSWIPCGQRYSTQWPTHTTGHHEGLN